MALRGIRSVLRDGTWYLRRAAVSSATNLAEGYSRSGLKETAHGVSIAVRVTPRGGHCGYMDALRGPSWIDRRIAYEFERG